MPNSAESAWLACPECGATCLDRKLPVGAELHCGRCGILIRKQGDPGELQRAWAVASAGLLLVVLANIEPILTFSICGNTQSNHIATGVQELWAQGYWPVAILVAFSGIVAPGLHLGAVWYVLGGCCLRRRWPGIERLAHGAELLAPWNLTPVYAVATVVSVVRLDMLGDVDWRQGSLWVLALSLCTLATFQMFNPNLIAERLQEIPA